MRLFISSAVAGAIALVGWAGVASADAPAGTNTRIPRNLTLSNPSQWANANENEVAPLGDPTTGTRRETSEPCDGCSSWVNNPARTTGGNQHLMYFQGNIDSTDPSVADPSNGDNPQLLFDPADIPHREGDPVQGLRVSDVTRVAWDTRRTEGTSGHWFLNLITKANNNAESHTLNYALLDDSGYDNDQWNTLQGSQQPLIPGVSDDPNDSSDDQNSDNVADGLELALYDHNRVSAGNQGADTPDNEEFAAHTLKEWKDIENTDGEPEWWNQTVQYVALGTATNYNDADSVFRSNVDNFQFEYDTGGVWGKTKIDLESGSRNVPEPRNLLLLGLGIGLILVAAQRRRLLG